MYPQRLSQQHIVCGFPVTGVALYHGPNRRETFESSPTSMQRHAPPGGRHGQGPPRIIEATKDSWIFTSKLGPPAPVEKGLESSVTIQRLPWSVTARAGMPKHLASSPDYS